MDQIENKHWAILAVVVLIGISFWCLDRFWMTEPPKKEQALSYEMPRPKEESSDYDLSGRRMVHNLTEAERRNLEKKAETPKTLPGVPTKTAAQKAADDKKKKEDAKKKAAANSKKKSQLGVRIADAEGASGGLGPSLRQAPPEESYQKNANVPPSPPVEEKEVDVTKADQDKVPKKTAEEWRALLFSAPQQLAHATEFHQSFKDGEVTSDEFYKITGDLLADASVDRQNLALSILKLEASVKTFSLLVSHYTEQTPSELRTQIYAILKTYGDLPRFSILVQLFASRNTRIVALASEVLTATLTAQNHLGQESRDRSRSPGAAPIPAESFGVFRPVLSRLAEAGNEAAKTLLTRIEALMTEARTA